MTVNGGKNPRALQGQVVSVFSQEVVHYACGNSGEQRIGPGENLFHFTRRDDLGNLKAVRENKIYMQFEVGVDNNYWN